MVRRIYVEKRPGFDVEARQLARELRDIVGVAGLAGLRMVNRYDVEGISSELFDQCVPTVFSEPQTDDVYQELPERSDEKVFAVEFLPGQFDMRASSASECIQLISQGERPQVRSARVYFLSGQISDADLEAIKRYVINPVEAREASLESRDTLTVETPDPKPIPSVEGFRAMDRAALSELSNSLGLAMDLEDLAFSQRYFQEEGRDPTLTEIRVIDTYWSDHCRHTTFHTQLDQVEIDDPRVRSAWERYLKVRHELGRDQKPVSLMDMGTLGARYLKAKGILRDLDESEEVNACTIHAKVDVSGRDEDWLYLFKNETHNHPTEIEPFGGAATCIGGCIRDPLSGRSYVYQAMRVTGAADPLVPVSSTLPGKLPQRKLVTTAAAGYSSYGNQIGLATGQVSELYHPGYVAKRMEIGAVVGATPADHVRRETPAPGDAIILLGGRTGRDGIGGATGSSKAHDIDSLEVSGAEVQKGNAPEERKIQRLFRRKDACRLIKRCNDFGAGGVSVAIGELADGIMVDLDSVPLKYDGLDGTEIAISESQERMACAVASPDVEQFLELARQENLEATVVARVTKEPRVVMDWHGQRVVDVTRAFLASNGAPKHQRAHVARQGSYQPVWAGDTFEERMLGLVSDLNVCGNKGLAERFDSTIGAATVLMPFGGVRQLTPVQAMVAKLPAQGQTTTCSGMAWGFNPYLTEQDQYRGAYLAVVESVSRLVATGFARTDTHLTFQEYFEKLRDEPGRWGKPVAALLGALDAQLDLEIASIGGKDSMSGSFDELDVPPTLVSFATALGKVDQVVSPEFKRAGSRVFLISPATGPDPDLPNATSLLATFDVVHQLTSTGDALSVSTCGFGGAAEAVFKMCLGNRIGLRLDDAFDPEQLFQLAYGSFVVELAPGVHVPSRTGVSVESLGVTQAEYRLDAPHATGADLDALEQAWIGKLEPVFPYRATGEKVAAITSDAPTTRRATSSARVARPRVVIPVFPGNNCEFDSAAAFERAGAIPQVLLINNLTPVAVAQSTQRLAEAIRNSQIVMIPGGFSGGDEPDGSAKFIASFFRAPEVTEAVRDLLQSRDGLMLGICNGFQALVKLGLVPYGDIRPMDRDCPTLTFNTIGRHQSRLVRTRVSSTLSPWLSRCETGDVHTIAISHGEGRFVASPEMLASMQTSGQIACQYVDDYGEPSMNLDVNPNGSIMAIEAITSPDGRVMGKMGHSERTGEGLYKNVPGDIYQPLFEGGVAYFTD